jgi:signal transduction histidine kinase
MLFWFPFVQTGIFGLFILISYMAFNASRRAEQNRVWVGMAKETAHQLGTPISSLLAWVELMRTEDKYSEYTGEMQKDLDRLETIVERFSKVGAIPVLKPTDLNAVLHESVIYMGIPRSKWKNVFQPGITTKQRGWGLGLSLAKRIINDYHNGNIAVKWSEPGKGTTIRILLKMNS